MNSSYSKFCNLTLSKLVLKPKHNVLYASSLLLHLTQIKRAQSLMLFRVSFEFVTEEKDKHPPSSDQALAWSPASNHHNLLSSLIPFTLIVTCLLFDNRIHLRSPIFKMRLAQMAHIAQHCTGCTLSMKTVYNRPMSNLFSLFVLVCQYPLLTLSIHLVLVHCV